MPKKSIFIIEKIKKYRNCPALKINESSLGPLALNGIGICLSMLALTGDIDYRFTRPVSVMCCPTDLRLLE